MPGGGGALLTVEPMSVVHSSIESLWRCKDTKGIAGSSQGHSEGEKSEGSELISKPEERQPDSHITPISARLARSEDAVNQSPELRTLR